MRTRARLLTAMLVVAVGLVAQPASAAAAQSTAPPSTPVHLSSSQVARALFVAGDVGRLSQVPSGTESVVLERVLQQLYRNEPTLDPNQAVSDIQALQAALSSGSQALSPATLTVMAGNERVLAILRALTDSGPPADVAHALAQVSDNALTAASQSTQMLGQAFDASADSLDTLSYTDFSPARTVADTKTLAASNQSFGQARDMLWKDVAKESVFDGTQTLLSENPALQNSAVKSIVQMLNPDGSLDTTVGQLETIVSGGIQQIGDQNCTLKPGGNGGSPTDCGSGALHDALLVAQQCANGNSGSPTCQAAQGQASSDATGELATIRADQAANAAAASALDAADQALSQAEGAEAQAAAALGEQEQEFFTFQSLGSLEKGGFDVAGLAVTLSAAAINPTDAVTGLVTVIGDAVGFAFPSGEQVVLQGIQNLSQQLSDFETYTQSAFHAIDAQLSNISNQIAEEALGLSTQLTQAQQQITQLATSVSSLQSSVDHLQSEVQSLFAQGARNDLGTLINQYIGFQKANGVPLPQTQFAQAAGALYQDATSTALTSTILNSVNSNAFDSLDASSLVTSNDPISLDSNINYFNYFPALVSDAPSPWPGVLTTNCPANSNPSQLFCLPDPDFWATSARAYAQLLMENPQYVTPTRVTQLNTIMQEGEAIANALEQLSTNDAGSDQNGTGNRTLDAAINYYAYWGSAAIPTAGGAPTLRASLHNEEQAYLGRTFLPGQTISEADIQPWGGVAQQPDVTGLLTLSSIPTNIPICASEQAILPTAPVNTTILTIPHLTAGTLSFLPPQVLNAVRLQHGKITACWTAYADSFNADGSYTFTTTITYSYVSNDGAVNDQVAQTSATANNVPDCTNPNFSFTAAAVIDVADSWPGTVSPNTNCTDVSGELSQPSAQSTTYQTGLAQVIEPQITSSLQSIQADIYNDIIPNGKLTPGSSQATNVEAAASRLAGANALMDGYVSLGLPQALASDDTLHGLVLGQDADPFTPTNDAGLNPWGVQYRPDVPSQVVAFYEAAQTALPTFDPADFLGDLIDFRAFRLRQAINPHIVSGAGQLAASAASAPRLTAGIANRSIQTAFRAAVVGTAGHKQTAANVAAAQTPTMFAEANPLIGPTLDRLDLTAGVIQDAINNSPAASTPATPTTTTAPATPTTTTAPTTMTAPTATTTVPTRTKQPLVNCQVKVPSNKVLLAKRRGSRVKPGTLAVVIRCDQTAKLTLSGKLTRLIGPRPKHGRPRSTSERIGARRASVTAGRSVSVRVKLPADALAALRRGAAESVTFTAKASNQAGSVNATANVTRLRRLG